MNLLVTIAGFVLGGITLEVFWTSISNYRRKKDFRLKGHSYLWMFPVYAIVPFIYMFSLNFLSDYSIFIRGLFYMFAFYLLEYLSGYLIKKIIGQSPWDYSNRSIKIFGKKFKSNFHGLICLEYGPVWYIYGILFEFYFLFLAQLPI